MQPTNRLYYDHAYLTAFDARVVAVRPDGWAALDCSAFYPTSGGQPYDTGTLQWGGVYGHTWFVDPVAGWTVVILTNTVYEGMSGAFPAEIRDAVYGRVSTS